MGKSLGRALLWGVKMAAVGALLTGCSESELPATEEGSVAAAELKPIDAETRALLKVSASVEVVGALPWVPAKGEPLDRAVLDDGGGERYDWSDTSYTGIFGRAGDVVNQLGFHGQSGDTPVAGGNGGSAEDIRCAEGKRLVGLAGAVSSNVNRLAPVCA